LCIICPQDHINCDVIRCSKLKAKVHVRATTRTDIA